jgi:hypothetical protein
MLIIKYHLALNLLASTLPTHNAASLERGILNIIEAERAVLMMMSN